MISSHSRAIWVFLLKWGKCIASIKSEWGGWGGVGGEGERSGVGGWGGVGRGRGVLDELVVKNIFLRFMHW